MVTHALSSSFHDAQVQACPLATSLSYARDAANIVTIISMSTGDSPDMGQN
jgi:hypothetical protein